MWKHYCKADKNWISVLIGQECSWCGCEENDNDASTTA
jgi:hypothetical protein